MNASRVRLLLYVGLGVLVLLVARPLMVRIMLMQENEKSKNVEFAPEDISKPSIGGASFQTRDEAKGPADSEAIEQSETFEAAE